MENLLPLILQLAGGAAGGNRIASLLKKLDLVPMRNTIVGVVGGFAGGQLTGLLGADTGGTDITSILLSLFGGGVGGGALTAIVGLIKTLSLKSNNKSKKPPWHNCQGGFSLKSLKQFDEIVV